MKNKNWKKQVNEVFSECDPALPSGFALTSDGKSVLITVHGKDCAVFVSGRDLDRLEGMIAMARLHP